MIFVHGIGSDPIENWGALLPRLARGRELFPEVYAADTDQLPTLGVRPDSLFGFGFYRESKSSPKYYTDRAPAFPSIGGCPVPRTDAFGARFQTSYAAQLDRAVENICRATGSERVDIVCYSMGGIVGRAYTRWFSVKQPGGTSRVRRLLTVGTMNQGLNSLEATTLVMVQQALGPHLAQGEAAELNYQCNYWSGQSYMNLLNDGWDAFCQQSDIQYGVGYGYGNSYFHLPLLQTLMNALGAAGGATVNTIVNALLVHPTPGFDINVAGPEAMGDGDSVVRAASSRMEPAQFPSVRFNAGYLGTHVQSARERSMFSSTWIEQLVRRFIFEGRGTSALTTGTGRVQVVDAGGEATWLALDLDLQGGEPLVAQVMLRTWGGHFVGMLAPSFGVGTHVFSVPLRPGQQKVMLDPAGLSDGWYRCELRLFGLEGVVDLGVIDFRLDRSGRALAPAPEATIGASTLNAAGGIDVPVTLDQASGAFRWALDDGSGAQWSAPVPAGSVVLPPLSPGSYEFRVRPEGEPNAAGLRIETPRPVAVRLLVSDTGQLTVTR
ncbi:MAG: alpha/beta hydrolase [Planctomycetota bacterium]